MRLHSFAISCLAAFAALIVPLIPAHASAAEAKR